MTSGGLPGPRPISSYFIHFPYVTGACPAAVLVMVPSGGRLMHVLPVSSTTQPPVGLQSEVGRSGFSRGYGEMGNIYIQIHTELFSGRRFTFSGKSRISV